MKEGNFLKLWIVVNGFLKNDKFSELSERFAVVCKFFDIDYRIVDNSECCVCLADTCITTGIIKNDGQPVLFWDKDILLARALEKAGHRVYNRADAIEICDNKALTSVVLAKSGLSVPKTFISPMTYENVGYTDYSFLKDVADTLGFPLVVKEAFGSFGAQVYLCNNYEELICKVKSLDGRMLIFQEFISESYGRDIRIQVVGGKVTGAMYRYSDGSDFRANVTNGAAMKPYEPSDEQKELAIKASRVLGLDFCGVDILFGIGDKPVLCEVNSNAHFVNLDSCTGGDTAKEIIEYIINEYKDI